MDFSSFSSGFAGKQALILAISLVCIAAGVNAQLQLPSYKLKDYPLGKVYANPNQVYHFAYNCLKNQSTTCPELSSKGELNVTGNTFCGPCSNQVRVVLRCIDTVKDDFLFENTASTDDVRTALDIGCGNGTFKVIPSLNLKSVGTKVGVSLWTLMLLGMSLSMSLL